MNKQKNAVAYLEPQHNEDSYPKPQSLLGQTLRPEFSIEVLPEKLRNAVLEVHDYVQAPIPMILSCLLGVLAAVAQGLVLVRRDRKLVGAVSLILLSVAQPNERKSFVETFFTMAIKLWEKEQAKIAADAFNNYQAALVAFEAIEARLVKELKSSTDDADIERLQGELAIHLKEKRPTKPLAPRIIEADSTREATTKHLSERFPIAAIISAEGGTVLGGNSLNQASIVGPLAFFNSLWSNESFSVNRAGDGETTLENVALTMSIAVQPDVVEKFLDKGDQMARGIGFLARALTCYPETTQGKRPYKSPPEAFPAVDAINETIGVLLRMLPEHIEDGALRRKVLNLSPEAKEVWIKYYDSTEAEQLQGSAFEFVRDVAGKSADNAARIAGILHLFDTDDPFVIGDEISASHMESGADIAAYYLEEAKAYLATTDLPENIRLSQYMSDRLRSYISKRKTHPSSIKDTLLWNEISKRNFLRMGGSRVQKLSSVNPLIDELLAAHHLTDYQQGKRSDSVVLTINPRLLEVSV